MLPKNFRRLSIFNSFARRVLLSLTFYAFLFNEVLMNNNKFAIIWNNAKVCTREDWAIATHFLKVKHLHLGIIRVNGQLFYSTRSNCFSSWQKKGSIIDTGNRELNRKAALSHFFLHLILPVQNGFHIIAL